MNTRCRLSSNRTFRSHRPITKTRSCLKRLRPTACWTVRRWSRNRWNAICAIESSRIFRPSMGTCDYTVATLRKTPTAKNRIRRSRQARRCKRLASVCEPWSKRKSSTKGAKTWRWVYLPSAWALNIPFFCSAILGSICCSSCATLRHTSPRRSRSFPQCEECEHTIKH